MPTIVLQRTKRRERTINKQLYQNIYQDARWKRLRAAKFKANPICERCERKGIVRMTDEVHHKVPFQTGRNPEEVEKLAFDYNNLESLCTPCHKEADRNFKFNK